MNEAHPLQTRTTKRMVVRLADQALWSAAFFVTTLVLSLALDVEAFAALATTTSLAFVTIAVVRSYAINAPIVVAARHAYSPQDAISARKVAKCSVAGAVCAGSLTAILTMSIDSGLSGLQCMAFAIFGMTVVLADGPRQTLIFRTRYSKSCVVSAAYFGGNAVGAVVWVSDVASFDTIYLWVAIQASVTVFGWWLVYRPSSHSGGIALDISRYGWRMGLEALYIGIGGQAAIFLLFLVDDATATEGIRLAYSLIYAPGYMFVQAFMPLYTQRISTEYAKRRVVPPIVLISACSITVIIFSVCAIGGLFSSAIFDDYRGLQSAVYFLVPIGISIASSQVFELVVSQARFIVDPASIHRLRLALVMVDILAQFVSVVVGGTDGLYLCLIGLAGLKLCLCAALVALPRIRAREAPPAGADSDQLAISGQPVGVFGAQKCTTTGGRHRR